MERTDYLKVPVAIVVAGLVAHYSEELVFLALGASPEFDNFKILAANCALTSFFLLLGWATRRIWTVAGVFMLLGLAFIFSYAFVIKGSPIVWIRQLSIYIVLPVVSTFAFVILSKVAGVPERPIKRMPQSANVE